MSELSKEDIQQLLTAQPLPRPRRSSLAPSPGDPEGDTWPPIWKPLEESRHYPLIRPYIQLEKSIQHDASQKTLYRLLKRVRKSRGFGLDEDPEELRGYPLSCFPLSEPNSCRLIREILGYVIAKLNALAQEYVQSHGGGEEYVYEFSELENAVLAFRRHKWILLALRVNESYGGQETSKSVGAIVFCGGAPGYFGLVELGFKKRGPIYVPKSSSST